ncbi:hypothetical protein [Photobacterium iliopiscarium]|uniref:hypothetical protein n=2 Tax=Photobacterium iliopiscarium TaxID=56192 RepID=UPI001F2F35BD|nr:hypothetical protein [Photobacterium iliopiscarium]MCF2242593.1 hypothetical protein [Photobacterium iliopiscarium]
MNSSNAESKKTSIKKISLVIMAHKVKRRFLGMFNQKKEVELEIKPIERKEIKSYRPDTSIKFTWDDELLIFDDFNHAMDVYESGDYTLFYIKSSSEGGPFWDVSPRLEITKRNQRQTIEALVAGGIDKDQAAKEVISWISS